MNNLHESFEGLAEEAIQRFERLLTDLPAPGAGFNPSLMPLAHAAQMCGMSDTDFVAAVCGAVKPGQRAVNESELKRAFNRTWDGNASARSVKPRIVKNFELRDRVIQAGREAGRWWDPVLPMARNEMMARQIESLFLPDDRLWLGNAEKNTPIRGQIMGAAEWARRARAGWVQSSYHHLILNPLGREGMTKDGKPSTTADANVMRTDNMLIEFDEGLSLEEQLDFWAGIEEPRLRCLTYSGGKSVHAVLYVGDMVWSEAVSLFRDRIYGPLGVDRAVFTPCRRARLAGAVRNGVLQQLMWSK